MADGLRPVPQPVTDYFEARERRQVLALRLSEILNSLVRPTLAILFGGTIVYMSVTGQISSGEFLGIAAVVVGYFFSSREAEKAQTQVKQQQEELVAMARDLPPPQK